MKAKEKPIITRTKSVKANTGSKKIIERKAAPKKETKKVATKETKKTTTKAVKETKEIKEPKVAVVEKKPREKLIKKAKKEAPKKEAVNNGLGNKQNDEAVKKAAREEANKEQIAKAKANNKKIKANNENVPEPIVPAEIITETSKKTKDKKAKKEVVHKSATGEYSEDIKSEYRNAKSQKELDTDFFKKLSNYKKTNEILWGRVASIRVSDEQNIPYIIVLWNGYEVLIPLEWYFMPNFDFGTTFAKSSNEMKRQRMMKMAEYQLNAIVCFTVKGLSWDVDRVRNENTITIIGDRQDGMNRLRNIYFNNPETRKPIEAGDIIQETHVLAVKEDNILVECRGVETRISAYYLNYEFVKNCNDYCKPGDTIATRVKTVGRDNNGNVYLALTGRLKDSSKNIKTMKVGQYITGVVDTYNRQKKTYTIILNNGVKASVHQKVVMGNIDLVPGDRVTVHVIKVYESFVVGMCSKA